MAIGTLVQGAAAKNQADYAANVANQNSKLAIEQSNEVQRQKAEEQAIIQRQGKEARGRQMTAMAGAGIDSSTGSGLDILTDTAYTTQQDVNQMEYNAAKKSWGYQQESENYKAEAGANKAAGRNAMTSAIIGAAGQVASSGSVSDKWKKKDNNYSFNASDYGLTKDIGKKSNIGFGVNTNFFPKYNNKYKF